MNVNKCFIIFVIFALITMIIASVIKKKKKRIFINDDIYTLTTVCYKGKPALVLVKVFTNESYIAVIEPFDSKM